MNIRNVPTRSVAQIIFEVDVQMADEVLRRLGGWPQAGLSRPCTIEVLDEKR